MNNCSHSQKDTSVGSCFVGGKDGFLLCWRVGEAEVTELRRRQGLTIPTGLEAITMIG